jgi:predicted aldo/keto reductase-like oxidoreductase
MANPSDFSRRDFIKTPLIGAVSVAIGALPGVMAQPVRKPIMRALGKTGITLPIVSMGVMNTDAPGLLRRAYEVGIRHFDTAAGYQNGRNERMVGDVVRELGVRDKVTVATKIRASTADGLYAAMEASLARLQMDGVDIVYLHGARDVEELRSPELAAGFAKIKKEGKARFVGFSAHSNQAALLTEAAGLRAFDVVLIAWNFTMAGDKALEDAIAQASGRGIGLVAMKTQAGRRRGATPEAASGSERQTAPLKWALRNEHITTAIPGFQAFDHIDQDFPVAFDLSLTDKERQFLGDKATIAQIGFCRQCGQCQESCPQRADIPSLMRVHMYAAEYENWDQARATYDEIPVAGNLSACADCETCSARCVNSVRIAGRIAELKTSLRPGLMA